MISGSPPGAGPTDDETMSGLPAPLQTLAKRQIGLLTRRQLRHGGVTNALIRWAIGRRWQLVLPGVVAIFTGRLDTDQRLMAGCLYAGRGALLSGPVGARLHGVTAPWVSTYPLLTFLVPEHRTNRTSGFVTVRRTQRPDLRSPWTGSPSPARHGASLMQREHVAGTRTPEPSPSVPFNGA